MDRLDELEVLLAVLDTGSLVGASRKLRRSAPAVTRVLAALEQRVGARLVERSTRRLAVTEAGMRVAAQARQLLSGYEDTVREHAQAPMRGSLRVTAPLVFGRRHVAPVVNSYLDMYPDMRVELVLNDRNLDLIDEGIDVALRIGRLSNTGLVARRVGAVRRMLVASPDYIKRRGKPKSLADLAGHDIVFTSVQASALEWRFLEGGRERTVPLTPRMTVNEIDAALMAAKAGRGLARALSYQVADDIASGALVRLLPSLEPELLPVQLVVPGTRHMASKVRAFLDHAIGEFTSLRILQQK